jgi:hypothetical protein
MAAKLVIVIGTDLDFAVIDGEHEKRKEKRGIGYLYPIQLHMPFRHAVQGPGRSLLPLE